jgi:hypothetical protein
MPFLKLKEFECLTALFKWPLQDQLERKNDDIHDQLKELLEFSKQTRQMMAAENEAQLSQDLNKL